LKRAALSTCGWSGENDLQLLLLDFEARGEFERSAAIAVWMGNIESGVEALQRGAEYFRSEPPKSMQHKTLLKSTSYAELLELASLSIAGYRRDESDALSSNLWRKASINLLRRDTLSSSLRDGAAYLRALIRFLSTVGIDAAHREVLDDSSLSLCDRVAFACLHLPMNELKRFLLQSIGECLQSGNIEGLIVTGIEKNGIRILQAYVDHRSDVQTAALMTSRVIFPSAWTIEREVCAEWLASYKSLLNSWQMWQSRAMFDVARADFMRKEKARIVDGHPTNSMLQPLSGNYQQSRRGGSHRKPSQRQIDQDILPMMPSQLDVRCNYCSFSLGFTLQESMGNQWQSNMKPVLSCCPHCRKPLPRCSICMLSLGTLNPYIELTRDRSRQVSRTGGGGSVGSNYLGFNSLGPPDDLSLLANSPFAEWFTWCVRCKHGGHAHHLVGWFAKHETCPVSGCDCRCQFDGIQYLKRPSLMVTHHDDAGEHEGSADT
jgi:WD repeat-containing protein mio